MVLLWLIQVKLSLDVTDIWKYKELYHCFIEWSSSFYSNFKSENLLGDYVADEAGMSLFAVHYNVNQPLEGVNAGEYNADVTSPIG